MISLSQPDEPILQCVRQQWALGRTRAWSARHTRRGVVKATSGRRTGSLMMRLWIDDLRPPPDEGWYWAKSSAEALSVLGCDVREISFDHDLGGDDTAMPVAREIERMAYEGAIHAIAWHIHSANPVGRANLKAAMESAEK